MGLPRESGTDATFPRAYSPRLFPALFFRGTAIIDCPAWLTDFYRDARGKMGNGYRGFLLMAYPFYLLKVRTLFIYARVPHR
jgi:hypothetical protein